MKSDYSEFLWGDNQTPESIKRKSYINVITGLIILAGFPFYRDWLMSIFPDFDNIWIYVPALFLALWYFFVGLSGFSTSHNMKEKEKIRKVNADKKAKKDQKRKNEEQVRKAKERKIKAKERKRKKEEKERKEKERNKEIEKKYQERKEQLIEKYGNEDANRMLNKEIWQGMTEEMLIESRGHPLDKKESVYKEKITLKFYYNSRITRQDTIVYEYEVTLENGKVVGWKDLD